MSQFRFRALITLSADAHDSQGRDYLSGTHAVMVRARQLGQPGRDKYFEAVIEREDRQPLHEGEHEIVTITLADGDAADFFAPGQRFALWNGTEIGTGIVSRQVFTPGSPS